MAHVTIPDEDTYVEYDVVASSSGPFNVEFVVFEKADLTVEIDGEPLALSGFSFTPTSSTTGGHQAGYVTLVTPVSNAAVRITRNITPRRTTDFAPGPIGRDAINGAFDRLEAQQQDVRRDLRRSIKMPLGETAQITQTAAQRALKPAWWDENGNLFPDDATIIEQLNLGAIILADRIWMADAGEQEWTLAGLSIPASIAVDVRVGGLWISSDSYETGNTDAGATLRLGSALRRRMRVTVRLKSLQGQAGPKGDPESIDAMDEADDSSDGEEESWIRTALGLNRRVKGNKRRYKSLGGFIKSLEDWLSRIYTGNKVTRTSIAGGLQAALTARAAGGTVIIDSDETITTGVSVTATGDLTLRWVGGHQTKFNIPNNVTDCITILCTDYEYIHIDRPNIDFQFTGRDGWYFNRGHIQWTRPKMTRPWRDMWHCHMDDAWDWMENFNIDGGGLLSEIGRHPMHVEIDNLSGVQFFNECNWDVEIRGIGRRHAGTENGGHGCNYIRITAVHSIYPVKVADWRFRGSNWDADQGRSYDSVNGKYYGQPGYVAGSSVGDMVEVVALNGSVIEVGGFDFSGCGGLESVSGVVSGKYVMRRTTDGSPGVSITTGGNQLGFTPYNHAFLFEDAIMNLDSVGGRYGNNGRFLEKILTKPNGIYAKGDESGWATGFRDIGRGFKKIVTMVSSTVVTVDIPVGTNGTYNDQSPIIVYAGHQPYWNGVGVAARWEVWVASTDKVNVRLFDELDTGAANAFDPSAVTWSRPSNGVVRMSITCGASVGAGGRNSTCWVAAARPEGIYNRFEKTTEAL